MACSRLFFNVSPIQVENISFLVLEEGYLLQKAKSTKEQFVSFHVHGNHSFSLAAATFVRTFEFDLVYGSTSKLTTDSETVS